MKKWSLLLGIIFAILVGGYMGLSYYGVKLIQPRLQRLLGPGFTLQEIRVKWTHLSIKGVTYEGLHTKKKYLLVEEVRIYPAILSLFMGPLRIREVTVREPSLSFYRTKEGVFVGPWEAPEKKERKGPHDDQEERESKGVSLKIDQLRIEKGSALFEDWRSGEPPSRLRLNEIDLEMKDIQYPFHSTRSPIHLKGKANKGSEIAAKGWINLKTLEVDTSLSLRHVDLKLFEPYYRKQITAQIDSGTIATDTRITLKEKMIDVPGKLEVTGLRIKEGGGTVFWIPADKLLSLLRKKGDRIQVSFHLRGSVGDHKFSLQEALLTQIALSLLEALK